jgi:formamidopyrimidine-DNA glycosylase
VAVKVFIMTNQVVAGVGNIYANESLFRAGIRPDRKVCSIKRNEWARLVPAIREVLSHAIECGGSTISDFVNAGREKGYFQINFKVYGRNGLLCAACGATIAKKTIGGRASYSCPKCQT